MYRVLNYLSARWNRRWINDCKIFFGTALVILGVGESKKGQAGERASVSFIPAETTRDGRAVEYFMSMDAAGKLRVDTIKEEEEMMMCYDVSFDEGDLYYVVAEMPTFPGDSLQQYIATHLKYPAEAIRKGITGKVFVQFIIEKDGQIDSVKVLRKAHPLLDAEALRVISGMPKWNPGKQRDSFVRVSYTIPINFTPQMLDSLCRDAAVDEEAVFCYVTEEMPVFPLGKVEEYVQKELKYPTEAKEKGIEGRVTVSCVIEKDGQLSEVKVLRGVHPLLDAEALRIVKGMPRWKPGEFRGEKTRVSYTIPVNFKLKK